MSRPEGAPSRLGIAFKGFLSLVLAAVLGLLALLFLLSGFSSLRDARQLERTPRSLAASVLPGEVTLQGEARVLGPTLTAPDSGKQTLYFDFLSERQERDRKGKTKWVTVQSYSKHVPFLLADESGAIRIEPSGRVDFDVGVKHTRRDGKMRYTERRIDAGHRVFVFGFAQVRRGLSQVGFDADGQYSPIIAGSSAGSASAHSGFTGASLLLLWIGLLVLGFAVYWTLWGLRIHQITGYLATLSLVMAAALLVLGVQAARDDLTASFARTLRDTEAGRKAIAARLKLHGIHWQGDWRSLSVDAAPRLLQGLDDGPRRIIEHLQERLALQVERTAAVRRQWPERFVALALSLPELPSIPLPAGAGPPPPVEDDDSPLLAGIVGCIGLFFAGLFGVIAFRRVRLKRTIENLATTRTAGVAYGLAEVKGTAAVEEGGQPLHGPLTERPCVWYHYVVQQRQGSGKKARWVTIRDERQDRRFCLVDEEGRLAVDPRHAEAIVTCKKSKRDGSLRYTEHWIEPGTPIYALGSALIDPGTSSSLLLARGDPSQPFLLTDLDERALLLRKARGGFLMLNLGTNAGNAAALALLGATATLDGGGFLLAALAPFGFFAAFLAVMMYNDLVTLRQRVRLSWSNIEVSLMKRADLVPQLESLLHAFLDHERSLHEQLARMRSLTAQRGLDTQAAGQLVVAEQQVIARVGALVEQYPELESSPMAMQLSASLVELENEVALMREGYNNAVERYNVRCQEFPGLLFARAFKFGPAQAFRAQLEVHAVPAWRA